jgi:PRTRC genetic system protein C
MSRIFVYDGQEYPDPDPAMTPEDIRRQYANYFPELSNAETKETKRGDDTVFTWAKRVGTKGADFEERRCEECRWWEEKDPSAPEDVITPCKDSSCTDEGDPACGEFTPKTQSETKG